jgi:hypothetical protein
MVDPNCFLIQRQRYRIATKKFREMVKNSIRQNGIRKVQLEQQYLESTNSKISMNKYGIDNLDMAFIMKYEVDSYLKRLQ